MASLSAGPMVRLPLEWVPIIGSILETLTMAPGDIDELVLSKAEKDFGPLADELDSPTQLLLQSWLVNHRIRLDAMSEHFRDEDLMFLEQEVQDPQLLHAGGDSDEWEPLAAVVDSGAVDSVAPPSLAPHVPLRQSAGSRAGKAYFTADGTRLPNQGEKVIKAVADDGASLCMTFQVAEVTKPFASVGKICDGDKFVVFGPKGGFIKDRWSGEKHYFERDNGVYMLRSWIPQPAASTGFARQG